MHPSNVRAVTRMQIKSLILQKTGTYNPMYQRPYTTNVDGTMLGGVIDRAMSTGTGKLTGALLAGVTNGLLNPSPTHQGEIFIPGGWNEQRVRFHMEVLCETSLGTQSIYYLQGYTSYPGVSDSGAIDPQMEFIFNSYICVSRVNQLTPAGYVTKDIISDSGQILCNNDWNGLFGANQYLMRPQDIFTGMHTQYVERLTDPTFGTVTDARAMFKGGVECNRRKNNIPANYLGSVIEGFYHSTQNAAFGADNSDLISSAQQLVQDPRAYENPVIRALSERYGRGMMNKFVYGDLVALDPGVVVNTNVIAMNPRAIAQTHQAGSTSYWNGSNYTTVAANILASAVPALMFETMLSRVAFSSTNTANGQVITIISDANGLTSVDKGQLAEMFVRRFDTEVIRDVTYNNMEQYDIRMIANLYGETIIDISIGGAPMERFVVPSFCDNLVSPVLAPTDTHFNTIVHDLDVVVTQVTEAVAGNSMQKAAVQSIF